MRLNRVGRDRTSVSERIQPGRGHKRWVLRILVAPILPLAEVDELRLRPARMPLEQLRARPVEALPALVLEQVGLHQSSSPRFSLYVGPRFPLSISIAPSSSRHSTAATTRFTGSCVS